MHLTTIILTVDAGVKSTVDATVDAAVEPTVKSAVDATVEIINRKFHIHTVNMEEVYIIIIQ